MYGPGLLSRQDRGESGERERQEFSVFALEDTSKGVRIHWEVVIGYLMMYFSPKKRRAGKEREEKKKEMEEEKKERKSVVH